MDEKCHKCGSITDLRFGKSPYAEEMADTQEEVDLLPENWWCEDCWVEDWQDM